MLHTRTRGRVRAAMLVAPVAAGLLVATASPAAADGPLDGGARWQGHHDRHEQGRRVEFEREHHGHGHHHSVGDLGGTVAAVTQRVHAAPRAAMQVVAVRSPLYPHESGAVAIAPGHVRGGAPRGGASSRTQAALVASRRPAVAAAAAPAALVPLLAPMTATGRSLIAQLPTNWFGILAIVDVLLGLAILRRRTHLRRGHSS